MSDIYSYHTFMFPFVWEGRGRHSVPLAEFLSLFEMNDNWENVDMQNEHHFTSNPLIDGKDEALLFYKEYQYFHPYARKALYGFAGVIVVTAIVLVYWFRYNYRLRKNVTLVDNEKLTQNNCTDVEKKENACANENAIQIVSTYSRYCCPRCNSKLVKRHGPYGDFYGCEAYAQTGCRYTRKNL